MDNTITILNIQAKKKDSRISSAVP